MIQKIKALFSDRTRNVLFIVAIGILAVAYFFQRFNYAGLFSSLIGIESVHPFVIFIVNKTVRLILNDIACCILIYFFFRNRKYVKAGIWIFAFEMAFLLPLYFVLKLNLEGDSEISSPLLSQLHRLIINPMLMILLMVGFAYQLALERKRGL